MFSSPSKTELVPQKPMVVAPAAPLSSSNELAAVAEEGPWYGRWYVWAGAAAVVTATVVAVVVLTRPPSAQSLREQDVNNCTNGGTKYTDLACGSVRGLVPLLAGGRAGFQF
jgi:hypothetical protein